MTQLVLRVDGGQFAAVRGATMNVTLSPARGAHTMAATAFNKAGNQSTSTAKITVAR